MNDTPSIAAVVLALLALPGIAAAQAPARLAGDDLEVAFVLDQGFGGSARMAGEALMDVGAVSASWRSAGAGARLEPRSTVITRRVGVRVTSRSGRRGFVPLRASVSGTPAHGALRVDGGALTLAPRVVDPQAPIGATVTHLLEIEVPPSAPPGAFASSIVWEVVEP